jgi:hypothetical protein
MVGEAGPFSLGATAVVRYKKGGQRKESSGGSQDSVEDCHGMRQFVQHLELKFQQQLIEWRHTIFPKRRNLRKCLKGEKLWLPNFWGEKGVIRVRVMPRRQKSTLSAILKFQEVWRFSFV